jgi:hypothetical protein
MQTKSACREAIIPIVVLFSLVLSAGFPPFASGQDQFVGNVKLVESKDPAQHPHIVRVGYSALIDIKPGDAVFIGDTLKTGEEVKAQIKLSDGSIITVAPNSSVQMKGYLVDREQGTRNSVLRTMKGTIRFVISRLFKPHAGGNDIKWKDSNVTIETQNAVAGVRGTDLAVTSGENDTEIAVFEGAVSVKSSSSSVNGAIMLGADQVTTVKKGKSPEPASALSSGRRESLVRLTTLTNPRSANGVQGGAPKKIAKYNDKDVARDLAEGTNLSAVMDKAVESGLPIEQVVEAMLDAGVNPSIVVYTAVIEGYSAKQVVSAAVVNGAPLSVVTAAAIGAGADKKVVISGAMDAGAPPAAIATAVANGTAPGAPVYGTSILLDPTPLALIPAPAPAISGGGGGTPSTQLASPR